MTAKWRVCGGGADVGSKNTKNANKTNDLNKATATITVYRVATTIAHTG